MQPISFKNAKLGRFASRVLIVTKWTLIGAASFAAVGIGSLRGWVSGRS